MLIVNYEDFRFTYGKFWKFCWNVFLNLKDLFSCVFTYIYKRPTITISETKTLNFRLFRAILFEFFIFLLSSCFIGLVVKLIITCDRIGETKRILVYYKLATVHFLELILCHFT